MSVPDAIAIEVRIDPSDPLLVFLSTAEGPVAIDELPAHSPAVARMRGDGIRLVVPFVAAGRLVGLLALGARASERPYARTDHRLLANLARFAAPALRMGELIAEQESEARRRERTDQEMKVAQLIQQHFLPSDLPHVGGWHVAAFYRPARTVGGDFYDLIELPDRRVMVVAGDVTDKGVPAALVMASTHSLLRSTATTITAPGEVLRVVNDLLIPQIPVNMFVTCVVLVVELDTGHTRFANAGHNLPYVRRDDAVVELRARGMPLGLMPGSMYEEFETVLEPDDILLLYSDGITEQHDAGGKMFGFDRTRDLMAGSTSGQDLVDRSVQALAAFSGEIEQEDDVTLVALHRGRGGSWADAPAFTVPSEPGREREVMERVADMVGDALPSQRLDALRTAVSEAAMNAIEHGNRSRADLEVNVRVAVTAEAVVVEIGDAGHGRPTAIEAPDLDLKLAGRQPPRGWGLFLIERLVDRVDEETTTAGHTVRLTMRTGDRRERGASEEGASA